MEGRTFLLFLIRHGEANHNVEEKLAQKLAEHESQLKGLSPQETKTQMEAARQSILRDESFFDASLSEQGCLDAVASRKRLDEIIESKKLPSPTRVLVSPLQRTLKTASIIFPSSEPCHIDNRNTKRTGTKNAIIEVVEEVRERLTGRPADNRVATSDSASRASFQCMDFTRARLMSSIMHSVNEMKVIPILEDDRGDRVGEKTHVVTGLSKLANSSGDKDESDSMSRVSQSSTNVDFVFETEEDLSLRTFHLPPLLLDQDDPVVAIVSHKGYLRALERTQLGVKESVNFDNGEIRVYRATLRALPTEVAGEAPSSSSPQDPRLLISEAERI